MDPERLATLRKSARNNNMSNGAWVRELLADRDYWEAAARRLRAECEVGAADVEAYGVTEAQCRAWLVNSGDVSLVARFSQRCQGAHAVAIVIRAVQSADHDGWSILDEMAATEVSP